MAQNIDINSPDTYARVLDYYDGLPAEVKGKLPPEDSDDWFAATLEHMLLATAPEGSSEQAPPGPRTRTAVHYTVLLLSDGFLNEDGHAVKDGRNHFEVVGSGFGSVGREPNDPKKHSDAKKLETRAGISVVKLQRKGINAGVMMVATKELPSFLGIAAQAAPEQNSTAPVSA